MKKDDVCLITIEWYPCLGDSLYSTLMIHSHFRSDSDIVKSEKCDQVCVEIYKHYMSFLKNDPLFSNIALLRSFVMSFPYTINVVYALEKNPISKATRQRYLKVPDLPKDMMRGLSQEIEVYIY
jgi:hypothetical protein